MGRPLLRALVETPGAGDWMKKIFAPLTKLKPGVDKQPSATPTPKQAAPEVVAVQPAVSAPSSGWPKGFNPEKALKGFKPDGKLSAQQFVQMRANQWAAQHHDDADPKHVEKWTSAGGVVLQDKNDLTKVLVIKPSNNYGPWAFPKGQVDKGETFQIAALREVWEETGVRAKFLPRGKSTYLGHGEGSMSITHFYLMYRTSGTPHPTDETEKAIFVTWEEALKLFISAGNKRDVKIALKAMEVLGINT